MYPNIDHAAAQANIASFFPVAAKQHCIKACLDFVMLNIYFRFRGQLCHQIHGTAMGTSVAPPYANLFLSKLEGDVSSASVVKPLYYKRFIDDGFVIWPVVRSWLGPSSRPDLEAFLHLWNTQLC